MTECAHQKDFAVEFELVYVQDLDQYVAQFEVTCKCGAKLQFKGLPAGTSFHEPRVSMTGTVLFAPMQLWKGDVQQFAQFDVTGKLS